LYQCGDGRWVHLHGAFPRLAERTVQVLGLSGDPDRETIAKTILGGIGKAQVQVAAPGTPAYDAKLDEEFAFNPAKARDLLSQAGLAAIELRFSRANGVAR